MEFDDLGSGAQSESVDLSLSEIEPDSATVAEFSYAKAAAERELNYLAESGSQSIDHRGRSSENNGRGPNGRNSLSRHLDTMTMLEMQSYWAAYNNPVTLNIGGREVHMTQGQLHEMLYERREQLRERLANTTDAAARARLEQQVRDYDQAVRDTDPESGVVTPEEMDRVRILTSGDEGFRAVVANSGQFMNSGKAQVEVFSANAHVAEVGVDNELVIPVAHADVDKDVAAGEPDISRLGEDGFLAMSTAFDQVVDPSNGGSELDGAEVGLLQSVFNSASDIDSQLAENDVVADDEVALSDAIVAESTGLFTTYAAELDDETAESTVLQQFQMASLDPVMPANETGYDPTFENPSADSNDIGNPTTLSFG